MEYIESPEFEFQLPKLNPNLLSADELICKGVILPFHLLSLSSEPDPEPEPEPELELEPVLESEPEATVCCAMESISTSRRWRNCIFKASEKKKEGTEMKVKKERGSKSKAELNINIWPFSRSHSAGTGGASGKKLLPVMRKSRSEPCSRSNSGRRWAAVSPGRGGGGIHLGRASPAWQGRRAGLKRGGKERVKGSVLNLSVNSCITGGGLEGDGSFVRFRSLFTAKKVY